MKHASRRTRSALSSARATLVAVAVVFGALSPSAVFAGAVGPSSDAEARQTPAPRHAGLDKLDHLIFIIQENRSFDHYFGAYPGADGLTFDANGRSLNCIPDPALGRDSCPYHTNSNVFRGGPHNRRSAVVSIDGGEMDGHIEALPETHRGCFDRETPDCVPFEGPDLQPDVMSYLDRRNIPNYWTYADRFVLQDRMFAPTDGWTLPSHLFLVSAWSAYCPVVSDPMSCVSNVDLKDYEMRWEYGEKPIYAWTDITYLLDRGGVSWKYYYAPDTCPFPPCQSETNHPTDATPSTRNPLPGFTQARQAGLRDNLATHDEFLADAAAGTLPSVSWLVPGSESDHPSSGTGVRGGQAYVTEMVNAVMRSPDWGSSAIFLAWDDWGGFYDHVVPPAIDDNGYGLRVPGLMMSPYAKRGYIDHQTLTFDAYLKLIEDRFLGGQRLDPRTDGRPDARPTVREDVSILGDLYDEFDFSQPPRDPVILDPLPNG
jgi:phospholipase C